MKSRDALVIFLILICFAGCSPSIISFNDKDIKANFVRTRGSRLEGGFSFVSINAQRFEKKDNVSYSLFVVYAGPYFINIEEGKTLVLVIDGQRFELKGKGSKKHRGYVSIGLVEEKAFYHDVVPDIIRRLSSALHVDIEIIGSKDKLKRHLGEKDMNNFRMFYDRVAVMSHSEILLVMQDSLPSHPQMK